VSLRTVRRWIANDEFEVVQLGRSVRIRKSSFDAFLRRRRRRT
jgi:excisionase family DNA binding protein